MLQKAFIESIQSLNIEIIELNVLSECDGENAQGGSILLPHETYCQLYYSCNIHGDQWPQYCPGGMLFAYAPGLAVCVTEGLSIYNCPNCKLLKLKTFDIKPCVEDYMNEYFVKFDYNLNSE